jgi:diguanylate cyclase (GGDEF)-like protein/PAS domain S-box-containing protein
MHSSVDHLPRFAAWQQTKNGVRVDDCRPTGRDQGTAIVLATEFDDVRLILRRWEAARAGDLLPPYEELALGAIGRFADEIAIIRYVEDDDPFMLRAGQRFLSVAGLSQAPHRLDVLPNTFKLAIGTAVEEARNAREPRLALCRWLFEGMVSTMEVVALPLSCRWPGEYFLLFLRPRKSQLNLARLLINSTRDGIVALSPVEAGAVRDFHILSTNDAAARFLGSTADALQFKSLSGALSAIGMHDIPAAFLRAATGEQVSNFELTLGGGAEKVVLQVGVDVADGILAVTLTDVRDIKARETLFRSLFDENPVPMYVRDRNRPDFLDVNEAALRLYGYRREEFMARDLSEIRIDGQADPAASAEPSESGIASRHRTADGRVLDVMEYASDIMVRDRPATLSTVVDITERKRAEAHVTFLAHHDPLTGVYNRTIFTRELESAADALARAGNGFSVIFIDLDDFKAVNDTFGHAVGDALLVEVTARLRKVVRTSDVVARLGGDEFALLLPTVESRAAVETLVGRILRELADIHEVDGIQLSVRASIGCARAPHDATETDELLKCVDLALYRAKHANKGTFRFYEHEMDRQHRERRALEMELRGAKIDEEFEVHYQPIVGVETGRLRGFEALIRWRNPRRGMVPPAEFIPIAEDTGLLDELGRWVLVEACRQAASWPEGLVVAVNVSPVQFRRGEIAETVDMALAASGLRPERLEIEITESVLLADSSANLATLNRLRARGIRIALDDFGTGYSSLSYLRQFPFSRLKIDRSFVREIDRSPESLAIIRAIIGLGKSLGIDTTAEGVETASQLETLRAERCGELQGFLFSPPVSQHDVRNIIGAFFDDVARVA